MNKNEKVTLSTNNLGKYFDNDLFKQKKWSLRGVNCVFPEASCTGLLGHNGAGKTTFIKLILGLLKPSEGEVNINNNLIENDKNQSIGYMPETNKIPKLLTVHEYLINRIKFYRTTDNINAIVEKHLKKTGLWEHKTKKISSLSKGLGRRVAWAQATIHNPKLLILDEPFSGLDPNGRENMTEWIQFFQLHDYK